VIVLIITVKDVRVKQLPELDDDFAADSGFETLQELRDDIGHRLLEREEKEAENEFRQAVIDAVVEKAKIEVPQQLIDGRAHELWDQVMHSLGHQGINKQTYLQITGKTEEEIVAGMHDEAEAGIKREAVLAAVAEEEKIDPSEDELLAELTEVIPPTEKRKPKKLLEQLKSTNRLDSFKASIIEKQAMELLVEEAKPIPLAQAEAREKIWTPEKNQSEKEAVGGLWTPTAK
jgi:trigger factor